MSLTTTDKQEVKQIAELKVRQYFDHFLGEVYPELLIAHIDGCPYGKKVSNFKYMLIGAIIVLAALIPTVGRAAIRAILAL